MKKIFLSFFLIMSVTMINAQTDSLLQYAGKYKFPDGSPVTEISLTIENGVLMGSSSQGSSEFRATSTPDVFEIVAFSGTATFKRTDDKVTGMQVQVGELNMEGTKTEGLSLQEFFKRHSQLVK